MQVQSRYRWFKQKNGMSFAKGKDFFALAMQHPDSIVVPFSPISGN